jgi:hypothetical protein
MVTSRKWTVTRFLEVALNRSRSMRGVQRHECDAKLVAGDLDVGSGCKGRRHERPALVGGTAVVRGEHADRVALCLVGDHVGQVGQVLAFDVELDHRPVDHLPYRYAARDPGAASLHVDGPLEGGTQFHVQGVPARAGHVASGVERVTLAQGHSRSSKKLS